MENRTELDLTEQDSIETVSYKIDNGDIDRIIANTRHIDTKAFLGKLFAIWDTSQNLKTIIAPDLKYVVKFPSALLKKMEVHDIQFLKDSMGELLPDLYDYNEKGFPSTKIRLTLRGEPTQQDLVNLHNSINNLIEHQRYASLSKEIRQIYTTVERIERGQDNFRFSKINAGRKLLRNALKIENDNDLKRNWINGSVVLLEEGRELVERNLIEKMDILTQVPENNFKRGWYCFWYDDYFNNQVSIYQEIQEYFQYYYLSIDSLAYAYTYLNQSQLIEQLLEYCKKILEHPKIGYLASVELLCPEKNYKKMWYKSPESIEKKLLKSYINRNCQDFIDIEVSGREILEVYDNV